MNTFFSWLSLFSVPWRPGDVRGVVVDLAKVFHELHGGRGRSHRTAERLAAVEPDETAPRRTRTNFISPRSNSRTAMPARAPNGSPPCAACGGSLHRDLHFFCGNPGGRDEERGHSRRDPRWHANVYPVAVEGSGPADLVNDFRAFSTDGDLD